MPEQRSELEDMVLEIRESWAKVADEYERLELHSDIELHSFYSDVSRTYKKGVDACDKFLEYKDIDSFVTEIIVLQLYYQAFRLSKFVKSDNLLKVISELKQEFGFTDVDDMEESVC